MMRYEIIFTFGVKPLIIEDCNMRVDTDGIARKYLDGGQLFVRTSEKDDCSRLVGFLESEGFAWEQGDCPEGKDVPDRNLPLVIDLAEKRIGYMGNVTSAAAAAASGVIMSSRDFYLLYSLHSLQAHCRS